MSRIVVIGSGASGAHFALSALQKGYEVTLLDAGGTGPGQPLPDTSFSQLKETLSDPASYFLGKSFEGVVMPGARDTFYGFPPSKSYVFEAPRGFRYTATGMKPYFTFARGGFAETWTGGAYAFNEHDLAHFPFGYDELRDPYAEVARRVGVCGEADDLAKFIPFDADYLPPLELDGHSRRLMDAYGRDRGTLNSEYGWHLGRSRVATLSRDQGERRGCKQLGRCLWGCPNQAIYTPALTLLECARFPTFEYRADSLVTHLEVGRGDTIQSACVKSLLTGEETRIEGDLFASAAGALMTSKIMLDTIHRASGDVVRLTGLMDNRQIHIPFLTTGMLGQDAPTDSYQFHHLAFGVEASGEDQYVHGQITTLKAASVHPIVQALPFGLKTSVELFRRLRAGLAIANVNLHDERRDESFVTIRPGSAPDAESELVIEYVADREEPKRVRSAVKKVNRALRKMGGFIPPGMTRVLPKGTSVHYAGTLPMSSERRPLTCSPDCRSHDFSNLLFVDAATFPFLPAKNHTFTLMANAIRVAEALP